jgi:8-oxo-dGTP diphosphatase
VIGDELFTHPAITAHAPPFAIIEMDVVDAVVGPHRHIDLVYVLQALSVDLTAQLEEVSGARWVPIVDVDKLDTPTELPDLVAQAVR